MPLVIRHFHLGSNGKKRLWFHSEAREEVIRIAGIFVRSAEPVPHGYFPHSRHTANLVLMGRRKRLRQRYPVTGYQSERLAGRRVFVEERLVDCDQAAEKAKRNGNAGDGENAPATISDAVLKS